MDQAVNANQPSAWYTMYAAPECHPGSSPISKILACNRQRTTCSSKSRSIVHPTYIIILNPIIYSNSQRVSQVQFLLSASHRCERHTTIPLTETAKAQRSREAFVESNEINACSLGFISCLGTLSYPCTLKPPLNTAE